MGANASSTISVMTQEISDKISQNTAASTTNDCEVKTGQIILKNADGCNIINKNFCNATAASSLDSIVDAATTAYNSATTAQKASFLPGINANSTVQDVKTAIKTELTQNCSANADLRNKILAGDITIDGCKNSTIQNINTGDAVATCGIRQVLTTAATATNTSATSQTNPGLFGDLGTAAMIIGGIITLVIVGLLVYFFFFRGSGTATATATPSSGGLGGLGRFSTKIPNVGEMGKAVYNIPIASGVASTNLPGVIPRGTPVPIARMFGGSRF